MNLHTGEVLWQAAMPKLRAYPPLDADMECEVLVIGGGVAGSLVSYRLTELGVDTVMVDKRAIAQGSSAANTGLLQFTNDKMLTSCIRTFGEKKGVRFYKLCRQAIDDLETVSGKLPYSPDFLRRSSLYYASSPEDLPQLQMEFDTLQRFGFPVEYWDGRQISKHFAFTKSGAIYVQGDAEVDPLKLVHALIESSQDRGLRVYAHTEVFDQKTMADGRLEFIAGNHRIRARYAVYATGYESQEIKRNPNAVLTSTFAIATNRIPEFLGWHERCLIWETARPYLYMRTTADDRIVIGGLDERTTVPEERERMLALKSEQLLEQLRRLFPTIGDLAIEYRWTGVFGSTHDGLPLIGRQDEFPNSYFMLGYGGNGTVYSMLGSQLVADSILKGGHPDMELFRFDRPSRVLPGNIR